MKSLVDAGVFTRVEITNRLSICPVIEQPSGASTRMHFAVSGENKYI